MDSLIEVINKIQNVGAHLDVNSVNVNEVIKLPQIAVVGSQSSGKSSVLENIVGKDFLPRGKDIVTRCPTILQSKHVPLENTKMRTIKGVEIESDWAVFEHCSDKIFTDFDEVRKEIERETDRMTNHTKSVTSTPICLKIYSHRVVDLTLVDLPGMTKVAKEGQPEDIEHQIRAMIDNYISNEKTIILAVSPANADLATSEAIKVAREHDPNGERTLAVLTKLDLMDRGTDAKDMLRGKVIPVKLGIIGVVNRSQEDIDNNTPIEEAHRKENEFLLKFYPRLASKNGTTYLAKRLSSLLMTHIRKCLPALKEDVSKLLAENEDLLNGFPDVSDKRILMHDIIARIVHAFMNETTGEMYDPDEERLCTGARIGQLFEARLQEFLNRYSIEDVPIKRILMAVRNYKGSRDAVFVPDPVFENLVSKQIRLLDYPTKQLAELVYTEMAQIVGKLDEYKWLAERFPKCARAVSNVVNGVIKARLEYTLTVLKDHITCEATFINTRNRDFVRAQEQLNVPELTDKEKEIFTQLAENPDLISDITSAKSESSSTDDDSWNPTVKEERVVLFTQRYMRCYFDITKESVLDKVPKVVFTFLVKNTTDVLHRELFKKLGDEILDDLFEEDTDLIDKRKRIAETVKILTEVNGILSDIEVSSF